MKSVLWKFNWPLCLMMFLVGCGGSKPTATLEVSRSFVVNSSGFEGGLIITGTNTKTGERFAKSLASGLSLRLELDAGTWKFAAIGWDGDSSSQVTTKKIFGGKPYCGSTSSNLTSANSKVEINVKPETCGEEEFAGSYAVTVDNSPTLPKLSLINTCKTLFHSLPSSSDDVIKDLQVSRETPSNFCESLPLDLKSEIKSIRIEALELGKGGEQQLGIKSECLLSDSSIKSMIDPDYSGNPYSDHDLRLPLKSIPLQITLFEKDDCTKPLTNYFFKNGLGSRHDDFDHIITKEPSPSNHLKLVLPANDTKRGYSPFAHLLPFFMKGAAPSNEPFKTTPLGVPSGNFFALRGETKTFVLDDNSCDVSTSGHEDIEISPDPPSCQILNGRAHVRATILTTDANNNNQAKISRTNGKPHIYISIDNPANELSWQIRSKHPILSKMYLIFGPDNENDSHRNFFGNGISVLDREDNKFGVLSRVRSMLAASGAGGVVSIPLSDFDSNKTFEESCEDIEGDKTIQIFDYERMKMNTYRVNIENITPESPGRYLCHDEVFDYDCSNVPDNTYTKKMTIWDYKSDLTNPLVEIKLDCNRIAGTYEMNFKETIGDLMTSSRKKINWNTNTDAYARLESIEWNQVLKNNEVIDETRALTRVNKDSITSFEDETFALWSYDYRATKNPGSTGFFEFISSLEARNDEFQRLSYAFKSGGITSTARGDIFSSTESLIQFKTDYPKGYGTPLTLTSKYNVGTDLFYYAVSNTSVEGFNLSSFDSNAKKPFGLELRPQSFSNTTFNATLFQIP